MGAAELNRKLKFSRLHLVKLLWVSAVLYTYITVTGRSHMVLATGLEPVWCFHRRILSPLCLPIPTTPAFFYRVRYRRFSHTIDILFCIYTTTRKEIERRWRYCQLLVSFWWTFSLSTYPWWRSRQDSNLHTGFPATRRLAGDYLTS